MTNLSKTMPEMSDLDWKRLDASRDIKYLRFEIEKAEGREEMYGTKGDVETTTARVMPKIKELQAFLEETG